jgi:hypothetical protein
MPQRLVSEQALLCFGIALFRLRVRRWERSSSRVPTPHWSDSRRVLGNPAVGILVLPILLKIVIDAPWRCAHKFQESRAVICPPSSVTNEIEDFVAHVPSSVALAICSVTAALGKLTQRQLFDGIDRCQVHWHAAFHLCQAVQEV